ncbi:predicted protein [Plenodomus lingam JN3]|uniref:Predicted protein n=1 Tax=Leptosphaeria maculans (strain JN3 / isolate v23.1.3 / race Av1-4-5-6-7-8) TaxID=985895 RepID=E5A016_LEPMJ|nr:predicted protein [Plenodomus lingam JN3]CBX96876.1 predicted protein [Plenodomus lingam JN3]
MHYLKFRGDTIDLRSCKPTGIAVGCHVDGTQAPSCRFYVVPSVFFDFSRLFVSQKGVVGLEYSRFHFPESRLLDKFAQTWGLLRLGSSPLGQAMAFNMDHE